MWQPGVEDEMSLSDDVAREFGHVKESQDRIENHLYQQDRGISEHFKKFQQHLLDDQITANLIKTHLEAEERSAKHRWVIISGILVTATGTIGIFVVEILKYLFLKG